MIPLSSREHGKLEARNEVRKFKFVFFFLKSEAEE